MFSKLCSPNQVMEGGVSCNHSVSALLLVAGAVLLSEAMGTSWVVKAPSVELAGPIPMLEDPATVKAYIFTLARK